MNFITIALAGVMSVIPVTTQAQTHPSAECLALNMYYEARDQGTAGLLAVSSVVLNRVNDSRFPNSICEVIYQGPVRESWKTRKYKNLAEDKRVYFPIKHKCQFSWYCDRKSDEPYNKKKYKKILD